MKSFFNATHTRYAALTMVVLAVVFGASFLARVEPAQAIPVEIFANPEADIKQASGSVVGAAFFSGLQYFINKIAYDSAVWLASGGKGEKPQFWTDPGQYFGDVGKNAAMSALTSLDNTEFMKKYGFSVCLPPNIDLRLHIKLDIASSIVNPPVPKCTFDQAKQAWANIEQPGYWSKVGISFEPGQNELSALLQASNAVDNISLIEEQKARDNAGKAAQGDVRVPVDAAGNPTVSKDTLKKQAEAQAPSEQAKKTEAQSNSLLPSILQGTLGAFELGANTFTNTLASQFMQRLMNHGVFSAQEGLCYLNGGSSLKIGGNEWCGNTANPNAQGAYAGRAGAALAFADLVTPKIYSSNNYETTVLAELGTECQGTQSRTLYSCTADSGLLAALQQAKNGAVLSVKDALAQGYLNPNWQLLPPSRKADNVDPNCFTRAYCYTNLVKLRQLGILPVGWELAAMQSDDSNPTTLKQAVDKFYVSGDPYYHLIDPNWLIKLPALQCRARTFGPFLQTYGSTDRAEYCADLATCVNEDVSGNCIDGVYGYCRKTKNIWRLGADICPAQFNTCTAVVGRTGQAASYLSDTINAGVCSAQNVGCRAYNTVQRYDAASASWQWADNTDISGVSHASALFFNKGVESCPVQAEGCSKFVRQDERVAGQELYLNKAPDYYHCYTGEGTIAFSSSTLNWPANQTDLEKLRSSLTPQDAAQCGRFAQVCSADEKGCELYTPQNGDPAVSGILSDSDVCPQECAGYQGFIQEPTFFDPAPLGGMPASYFIPSTAAQCNEENAGCDEFVNIEVASGGGERKEYYTELRACSKNEANGASYYTWEGSDTAGYQLKSYTLATSTPIGTVTINNAQYIVDDNAVGSLPPAYNTTDQTQLNAFYAACNQVAYKNQATVPIDPDCREFYDKDGHISYRLYSHTITVDPSACKMLRKSVTAGSDSAAQQTNCASTGGTWNATSGFCAYLAIPSEGTSCQAQFNGCRAYKGNGGNNFDIMVQSTFEDATTTPWKDGQGIISAESTALGGHSVKIKNTNLETTFSADKNATYIISFWAKGTKDAQLGAGLYKGTSASSPATPPSVASSFTLQNDWQVFSAGPFTSTWDPKDSSDPNNASSTIGFTISSGTDAFIDNITIKKQSDFVYVNKNSWVTPASCDNPAGDPYGVLGGGTQDAPLRTVPQAMLGCMLYTNRAGSQVAAKSFTNICRAEAVGCEQVTDTHNTETTQEMAANILCSMPVVASMTLSDGSIVSNIQTANQSNLDIPCVDSGGNTLCSILPGQQNCRFTAAITGVIAGGQLASGSFKFIGNNNTFGTVNFTASPSPFAVSQDPDTTHIIPADNTAYLVNDAAKSCTADNMGCEAEGVRTWIATSTLNKNSGIQASYSTAFIKNQPDNYTATLCQPEAEACEQYTTGKGGQLYFKDPSVFGGFTCEWKENVQLGGQTYQGWFRTGDVGYCGAPGDLPQNIASITQCQSKNDCAAGQDCLKPLPCYPKFLANGDTFGMNKVGDQFYNTTTNPIAICPAQFNACTEYIDPSDTSTSAQGASYFVLDNGKLDSGDCNGQVSMNEGCVLFNKTSEVGAKPWSSKTTYAASEAHNFALVAAQPADPSDSAATNDANLIIKVKRDRVCSEWLTCRNWSEVQDPSTGQTVKQCLSLGACDKAGNPETSECAHYENTTDPGKAAILTPALYTNRNLSFIGNDYTGYSIPNQYPAEFLRVGSFQTTTNCPSSGGTNCEPSSNNPNNVSCAQTGYPCGAGTSPVGYCDNNNQCVIAGLPQLGFAYCPSSGGTNCEPSSNNPNNVSCTQTGYPCGAGTSPSGYCDNDNQCLIGITGDAIANQTSELIVGQNVSLPVSPPLECRGYPAADAPYGRATASGSASVIDGVQFSGRYAETNKCHYGLSGKGNPLECECSYAAATYGDTDRKVYFKQNTSDAQLPSGICSGGTPSTNDGIACDPSKTKIDSTTAGIAFNADCGIGGTCMPKKKIATQFTGWQGYCLQYDTSQILYFDQNNIPIHPCLAWYPVDQAPGSYNIYGQDKGAGYGLTLTDNQYYCAQGSVVGAVNNAEGCWNKTHDGFGASCNADIASVQDCLNDIDANKACGNNAVALVGVCNVWGINGYNGGKCTGAPSDCPFRCISKNSIHMGLPDSSSANYIDTYAPGLQFDTGVDFRTFALKYFNKLPTNGTSCFADLQKIAGWLKNYHSDYQYARFTGPNNSLSALSVIGLYNNPGSINGGDSTDPRDLFRDCIVPGITDAKIISDPTNPNYLAINSQYTDHNTSNFNITPYAACVQLAQVTNINDPNSKNKAWTDCLANPKSSCPVGGYTIGSNPIPFGRVMTDPHVPLPGQTPSPYQPYTYFLCLGSDGQYHLPDPINLKCNPDTELRFSYSPSQGYPGLIYDPDPSQSIYMQVRPYFQLLTPAGSSVTYCTNNVNACLNVPYSSPVIKQQGSSLSYSDWANQSTCGSSKVCVFLSAGYTFQQGLGNNIGCATQTDCVNYLNGILSNQCRPTTTGTMVNGIWQPDSICVPLSQTTGQTLAGGDDTNPIGRGAIEHLFAKIYNLSDWKPPTINPFVVGSYATATSGSGEDQSFSLVATDTKNHTPPILHPTLSISTPPTEVQDAGIGFSINNKHGTVSTPYYIVGHTQKPVTLSFYGYADKNQMPLRRIAVDWGDPSVPINSDTSNYYKNRRQTCNPSNPSQGGDGWGGDPNACVSGSPFIYQFVYTYTSSGDTTHCGNASDHLSIDELNAIKKQGIDDIYPDTQVCVYQPKVQLLDNWGWCNASAAPAKTHCVDFGSGVFGCYANGFNPTTGASQDDCSFGRPFPWTLFAGKVIVLP